MFCIAVERNQRKTPDDINKSEPFKTEGRDSMAKPDQMEISMPL